MTGRRMQMRRPVVVAMSGISVIVVGVSLHASQQHPAATALGTAAIVTAPPAVVAQAPSPGRHRSRAATPAPTATRSAGPTAVRAKGVRATAVRTPGPAPTAARRTSAPAVTINGATYDTQYGPVQVQITVRSKRITSADAVTYPQDGDRSREINSYAVPKLDQETLTAQRAQIDTVSGATYTSEGYRSSLQSAIDAAHKAGAL